MREIYIDSIFFINLIINYLLLVVSSRVCGVRIRRLRCLLGGALGAVYAVFAVFPELGFLTSPVIKLCTGVLLSLAVFGGEKRFFRLTLVFFAVSAGFAGVICAASIFCGYSGNGLYVPVSMKLLILSFALCYFVFSIIFRRSAKHSVSRESARAEISYGGASMTLEGIFDTGNSLSDPMTGGKIAVASLEKLLPLFPREIREILRLDPAEAAEKLAGAPGAFRPIPYSAVGVRGLLLTFRPDKLSVNGKEVKTPRIALSPTPLSADETCGILI